MRGFSLNLIKGVL